MLTWRVPIDIPDANADIEQSDHQARARAEAVCAHRICVRVVKLQADGDFQVQVAQSRAANAPQVIVEVPRRSAPAYASSHEAWILQKKAGQP